MSKFLIPGPSTLSLPRQSPAHAAPSLLCCALRRALQHMLNSEHADNLTGKKKTFMKHVLKCFAESEPK